MIEIYLFDWGDTLMVDFPGVPGKMCTWKTVEAVEGAFETLECLSKRAQIYIASAAEESTEDDIFKALERVKLSQFISGYFCKANMGISKGHPDFLPTIVARLGKSASVVTMVGDNLKKDIEPALAAGIKPVLLSKSTEHKLDPNIQVIGSLRKLCTD